MGKPDIPFVAVIGGFTEPDAAAAKAFGKAIGAELAKAGFGLVVYGSDDDALGPPVVSGYAAAARTNRALKICVRCAESQLGKVKFIEEADRPTLFEHRTFPGEDWEAPFYQSLVEEEGVDAVLLLGGATSVFIAGHIAIARGLPILVVNAFGEPAQKIWRTLVTKSPDRDVLAFGRSTPRDLVERLKNDCAAVAKRRAETRSREREFKRITAERKKTVYAVCAGSFLLAALFFGMVYTPFPSAYLFVMLAALISGGATGALVRVVFQGPKESDPLRSALLGGFAGFVVGLAYLIPQWIGAPSVLEPRAITISATDKIQFASVVLVAIGAGVGFDTVFARLQKQAQDAAVGPPR